MGASRERAWIAGRLGREDLTDSAWDLALCLNYLADLDEGESRIHVAAKRIADLLAYIDFVGSVEVGAERASAMLPYADVVSLASSAQDYDGREEGPGSSAEHLKLEERELERAKALGDYVAYEAAIHPSVQRFRMFVLGDYVLPREAVWELQDSPSERPRILGPGGVGMSSGFLDELEEAAERVSRRFRGYWSPEQAIEFVLADKVSWRFPARVRTEGTPADAGNYGTITLEVEPWVPSSTVAKLYQHEQTRVLGQKSRALSLHGLRVVRFVLTQIRAKLYARLAHEVRTAREDTAFSWYEGIARKVGEGPGELLTRSLWRPLMERWNEITDEAQYESERRFRKDFYRTTNVLTGTLVTGKGTSEGDAHG